MAPTLESKLAAIVRYLSEKRAGRHNDDHVGLDHYLDDAEVMNWVHEMNLKNRVHTGRFINLRGGRPER